MSDYQQRSPIGYSRESISDAGQDILRNNNAGTKVYVPTVEFGSKHGAEAILLTLEEWIRARNHLNTGVAPQDVITVATLWSFVLRMVTGAFRERWIALVNAVPVGQQRTVARLRRVAAAAIDSNYGITDARSLLLNMLRKIKYFVRRGSIAEYINRFGELLDYIPRLSGNEPSPNLEGRKRLLIDSLPKDFAERLDQHPPNGIQSILSDPAIGFDLISQTLMRYARFHVPTDKKKSGKRKRDDDDDGDDASIGDDASNGGDDGDDAPNGGNGNGDGGKSKKNKNGKRKRSKPRRAEKADNGNDADICTLGFCNRDGKTPNHSNADCKWQKKGLQGPQWWNSNGNDIGNGHHNHRDQVRNPRQGQGQGYRPDARDASFFADVIGTAVAAALGVHNQGFQGQGPPQGQHPFQPPAQREAHFADGYGPSQGSGTAFDHMRQFRR
ncbi:hypothetical protein THAOC_04722 [Thalassiosira oceanica]|uniref:Uncharacterized protein n=1 Tax=Thalassiosira oceanica TaxID=159749 RepID=K0TIN2_THAOC|nr:hypothetical protein THAOC_04722 [Thalassiosira oceanica]|eukprot:EJK73641.1 hypothetical protein THAOC_04722 [Thalassiosira oceanica]